MSEIADVINESNKLYSERREKLIYFMMAASGAAIGFIVTKFNNDAINYINVSQFLAIIFFSCSFLYGYSATYKIMDINRINANLYRGLLEIGNSPENYKGLTEAASGTFDKIDKSIRHREIMQLTTIIVGSIFYISGQIIDGYLKDKMTDVLAFLG